jgi:hypothetical protein
LLAVVRVSARALLAVVEVVGGASVLGLVADEVWPGGMVGDVWVQPAI